MPRLCVSALILALALATFSEASWKPRYQLQEAPLPAEGVKRGLEPQWPDRLGPASHQRRQMGLQGPPHLVADLSKKAPWLEEEEEAYGWMDFGRRSAEDGDQRP